MHLSTIWFLSNPHTHSACLIQQCRHGLRIRSITDRKIYNFPACSLIILHLSQHWYTASNKSQDVEVHCESCRWTEGRIEITNSMEAQSTMNISLPSVIKQEYSFRLVLTTVWSVLSWCNRPPRVGWDDNRKAYLSLTSVFVAEDKQYCTKAQKNRRDWEARLLSGAVINSQTHWAKLLKANSLCHNNPIRLEGVADGHIMLLSFHCSPSSLF